MSEYIELSIRFPKKLADQMNEYGAITEQTLDHVVERAAHEFLKDKGDLLALEWGHLGDKFSLEYEKLMDARQAWIDIQESIDKNASEENFSNDVKMAFKALGLPESDEFFRYIQLDLLHD